MNPPLRRPLRRDNHHIETTLQHALTHAPTIELGWTNLTHKLRNAGWPTRTPDHDRTPNPNPPEPPPIDYHDPTGQQATHHLHTLTNDLHDLETHWTTIRNSLHAIQRITSRYIDPATPHEPACTITTCTNPVERTTSGKSYRGCEQIAGHWVAKPGERPVCAMHRKRHQRGHAA